MRSIGFAVLVFGTQTSLRGVWNRVPEIVDESTSQLVRELGVRVKSAEKADEIFKEELVVILDTLDFGIQQLEKSPNILEAHIVELREESRHLGVIVVCWDIGIFRDWAD